MLKHRNSQKRVFINDGAYFVTSKTLNNYPYFKEPIFCDLFVGNLKLCKKLKGFALYAWVLMYDHFHLLIHPGEEFGLSEVMFSIKKQISHNINVIMGNNKPYTLPEGAMTPEGAQSIARLRGGYYEHYQSTIDNHDKKLQLFQSQFLQKHSKNHEIPKFQWQKSYHDHYIRNKCDFMNHWEYIKYNPAKHKMPEEWKYIFLNPKYKLLILNFKFIISKPCHQKYIA